MRPAPEDPGPEHSGPENRGGEVHVVTTADEVLVTLAGDVDGALRERLDEVARALPGVDLPVRVDAAGVTFMDSTGARFLSRCYVRGPLTVVASPPVAFLLRLLAMDDVLVSREP